VSKLILMDFDGTITYHDTMRKFLIFTKGIRGWVYYFFLFRLFLIFKPIISADWVKITLLKILYLGTSKSTLESWGKDYVSKILPKNIRNNALLWIIQQKNQGHEIVIVTASIKEWVLPWCNQIGIKLLSTELNYDIEEKFSGAFAKPNCYGHEKVKRILEEYDLQTYTEILVFGDSDGDEAMYSLTNPQNRFHNYF
jgi:phosphatidylglycerophosphatase C